MNAPYAPQSTSPRAPASLARSAWLLILANLVPLIGVLFFDWKMSELLLLYWLESAVIGGYNVIKMIQIGGPKALPLCIFFCIHYGGFMAGHLVFLDAFFFDSARGGLVDTVKSLLPGLWPAVLALVVSHGFAYYEDFLRNGAYQQRQLNRQMTEPYVRIFVMQLTLILGSMLSEMLGTPLAALVLLIVLKVGVDLKTQQRLAHKQAAEAALSHR